MNYYSDGSTPIDMHKLMIPELVAHRGYLNEYPENTWVALEAALRAGACWLEFDVQMCRDNCFVLAHDDNLLRTAGVDLSVLDSDSHRLSASVHEPQRFGERFAPTPVTTLADTLARLSAWPQARAMVEIKQESLTHRGLETVMQHLLPLLLAQRRQCTLISYNAQALAWLRQRATIPIGWVLRQYNERQRAQARALAPDYLICNACKLPEAATPWSGPWQWMLYDIVEPRQALAWAARGVALIETADIGAMLRHPQLAQRACAHAAL